MEDLLSTVFILIPIAVFIAVKMAADKKKKAQEEERKKFTAMLAHSTAHTPRRPERNKDDEFDAHSLVPDDDESPAAEEVKKSPASGYRPLVAESAANAEQSPAFAPHPAHAYGENVRAKTLSTEAPGFAFPSRVENLPPLKKAVVLSELLREPKGW